MFADDCLIDPNIQSHSPSQEGQDMEESIAYGAANAPPIRLEDLGYVQVVRCKYCRFGRTAVSAYADMYCVRLEKCVTAEWYCADGDGISNAVENVF